VNSLPQPRPVKHTFGLRGLQPHFANHQKLCSLTCNLPVARRETAGAQGGRMERSTGNARVGRIRRPFVILSVFTCKYLDRVDLNYGGLNISSFLVAKARSGSWKCKQGALFVEVMCYQTAPDEVWQIARRTPLWYDLHQRRWLHQIHGAAKNRVSRSRPRE
jgi:hypothetical protein